MARREDRRREYRIRFCWPLWFGHDDCGELKRGQVVDLSCRGVSFTVEPEHRPHVGDHVLTRFSFPHNLQSEFEMGSYFHWAEVLRVEESHGGTT